MKKGVLLALHGLLLIYSFSGVFSKLSAGSRFPGIRFCVYYGAVLLILFLYAIGWQQIIKRMSLSAAFANKAVTTVWGTVWGILFFSEKVTPGKVIGILLIIGGIVLFTREDDAVRNE